MRIWGKRVFIGIRKNAHEYAYPLRSIFADPSLQALSCLRGRDEYWMAEELYCRYGSYTYLG